MPMKLRMLAEGVYGRALGEAGENLSEYEDSTDGDDDSSLWETE